MEKPKIDLYYKRRINSMFNRFISDMKFLLLVSLSIVALFAFVFPNSSKAGIDPPAQDFESEGNWGVDITDSGAWGLVYYYDTQDRETVIQLTNISGAFVPVHVQAWQLDSGKSDEIECVEEDFTICLTPGQTIIWDVKALPQDISLTGYGFITAYVDPTLEGFAVCEGLLDTPLPAETAAAERAVGDEVQTRQVGDATLPLIGMFRVIDDSGYEYRTNAVAPLFGLPFISSEIGDDEQGNLSWGNSFTVHYNNFNGHSLSDVIGITYAQIGISDTTAGPDFETRFGNVISPLSIGLPDFVGVRNYDADEMGPSCPDVSFACEDGKLNRGADRSIPSSKGFNNAVCPQARLSPTGNDSGFLWLPFKQFLCNADFGNPVTGECDDFFEREFGPFEIEFPILNFVGFVGLNDGNGNGSMDSWWYNAEINIFDLFD